MGWLLCWLLLLCFSSLASPQTCPGPSTPFVAAFSHEGGASKVAIPPTTTAIYAQLWGAGGAGGRSSVGGGGAYVAGWLSWPPSAPLLVFVGGGGRAYPITVPRAGGAPQNHPNNFQCAGTGAGATFLARSDTGVILAVAGAGGSGGEAGDGGAARYDGGVSAATNGTSPANPAGACTALGAGGAQYYGGLGASASVPGAAGCASNGAGSTGTGPLTLAAPATGGLTPECGGPGGGGWFGGGGGGWWGGGGAGSSFLGGLNASSVTGGNGAGAGAGGAVASAPIAAGAGAGGAVYANGGDGLAVLTFCVAPAVLGACPAAAPLALSAVLTYSGSVTSVAVPPTASAIFAGLWGGGGAGGRYPKGGGGAFVGGWLPNPAALAAGRALIVAVGGGGLRYPATAPKLGGAPISHPQNYQCAGTGAGASFLAAPGGALLAVAGAGGSGGETVDGEGGAARGDGASSVGANGTTLDACGVVLGWGGGGATAGAPGRAGCGSTACCGGVGVRGGGPLTVTAFTTGATPNECGGAGGGGYFGGGSGAWHGGGGAGSSWSSFNGTPILAHGSGALGAAPALAAAFFSPGPYAPAVGAGGSPYANGGDGLVALTFCVPAPAASAPLPVPCAGNAALANITIAASGVAAAVSVSPAWGGVLGVRVWGPGGAGGHYAPAGGGAFLEGLITPAALAAGGDVVTALAGGAGAAYPVTSPRCGGSSGSHPSNFGCAGTGAGATVVSVGGALVAVAGGGGGGGEGAPTGPAGAGGDAQWHGAATGLAGGTAVPQELNAGSCAAPYNTFGGLGGAVTAPGGPGCGSQGALPQAGRGPLAAAALSCASTAMGSLWTNECGGLGGSGFTGGGGGGWHGSAGAGSSFFNSSLFTLTYAGSAVGGARGGGAYGAASLYGGGEGAGGAPYANGGDGLVVFFVCEAFPPPPACAVGDVLTTWRFFYAGSVHVFFLPVGAYALNVSLWGAGGAGGRFSSGGGGAFVRGAVFPTPAAGQSLAVAVGGGGNPAPATVPGLGGVAHQQAGSYGCTGTGAGATAFGIYGARPFAVAGAGGGGGETVGGNGGGARWDGSAGGDGSVATGDAAGGLGSTCPGGVPAGGGGATGSRPGTGGCQNTCGGWCGGRTNPGSPFPLGLGTSDYLSTGASYSRAADCGGMGGGGKWGGGAGGWHHGGGAGSSDTAGLVRGGAGEHAAGAAPGGTGSPLYALGVGAGGGPASPGGAGLAALSFCTPPPPSFCPATASLTSATFPYAGVLLPFTVRGGTLSVYAQLWGGGGSGGAFSTGGAGAYVAGFLSPTPFPGSVLSVLVGGGGLAYGNTVAKLGGTSIAHPSNCKFCDTRAPPREAHRPQKITSPRTSPSTWALQLAARVRARGPLRWPSRARGRCLQWRARAAAVESSAQAAAAPRGGMAALLPLREAVCIHQTLPRAVRARPRLRSPALPLHQGRAAAAA
jgi:hypothetical protein